MSVKNKKNEQFKISSDRIISKVKELVKEGSVRRIIIKKESGEVLMEIPLTIALVGAVLAPILAAIGALTALATDYIIVVEKRVD